MYMDFYERVKELVKGQNTTLQVFMESLDIKFETYRGQKRHGNLPRADEALRIANALHTSINYLVTGEEPNGLSEEDREHLSKWHKIDEGTKRSVNLLIDASISAASEQDSRNERISV